MGRHSDTPTTRIPLFGRKQLILRLLDDNTRLTRALEETGGMDIYQKTQRLARLDLELVQRQAAIQACDQALDAKQREARQLDRDLVDLRARNDLQEVGFYDYEHPAETSVALKQRLIDNRNRQRDMLYANTAILATTQFRFNDSVKQGRDFLEDMKRMALGMFNAEAENCVKTIRAGNLTAATNRLNKCDARIRRFGRLIGLAVNPDYLELRVMELRIAVEHLRALEREREAEKTRKAELREQEKARRELEAQAVKLRKEREHYERALHAMQERGDTVKAGELAAKLADLDNSIRDNDYRTANERAGYVYVISDIGAFGEGVVKIGMTRRLEPMDRIRELSDASVPFRFDVHALIFSKDAVSLETMLHHEFEADRVNKVNAHKEFYRVSPQRVLDKLREKDVAVVEFTVEPEAAEYRETLALERGRSTTTV